jgi:hypothetical protein
VVELLNRPAEAVLEIRRKGEAGQCSLAPVDRGGLVH